MRKTFSWEAFEKAPIIAIFRNLDSDDLMQVASCFQAAGLSTMEITLNSVNATADISRLVEAFGDVLNIGAGTICDLNDMHEALDAGAQFIVTPISDIDVINFCVAQKIPVFPGAFTPTEIYKSWQMGATMVKVFPAGPMGPGYIKDIQAPLNEIKLLPTGGINEDNIQEYFEAGARAVGVGSALVPKNFLQKQDWEGLTRHLKSFFAAYQKFADSPKG
ncbi:bifunctional 4-hydroxy-2-oxoglutarate aldolase/2-dehydro-3-deoxy-phosphogluconate aldolase [Cyclobacterium plantarum]|uniref:Bifunctional 4-hydroxy-2-oxoglutarate aldolase/2-dehydro-3-deoxy-phosphogluconate aldolase n=1 Tax=Cyclobacterium plantarum TaxID=2716263 RepID=A0ABX0H7A0_9BACT|nr:bifunctional 4-hydroxy-2-oxoglutarate aldolase/2-dehydro-3-deoxy-phosphogluconate aldolase [Cyclobacterium plantarum]NHE57519.1 bifunctional 4-hydroxy-2-oxoglutarate aldolase/2-dehydro-3-deoxy-phosphogluconate aldolase [Cyclobacterium plantarum]